MKKVRLRPPGGVSLSSSPYGRLVALRFWAKVDQRGPDECWPWMASTNADGYGKFKIDGTVQNASRVALEIHTGALLPHDQVGMHSCDNPPCCNPAHLSAGTQADNLADMVAKGRHWTPFRERNQNQQRTGAGNISPCPEAG